MVARADVPCPPADVEPLIRVRTAAVDETRSVGSALGGLFQPGDILLLAGEMGAGKTAFTQGLGEGLGVTDRITSPTFTIAQEYAGRLTLHHLDMYRLSHLNEALDVGLGEIIEEEAVIVIEWGDAVVPLLPRDYLEVRFGFGESDDDRTIEFAGVGSRWLARHRRLTEILAPWGEAA